MSAPFKYMSKIKECSIVKRNLLRSISSIHFWKQKIRNALTLKRICFRTIRDIHFSSLIQIFLLFGVPVIFTPWGDDYQIGCEMWFCFLKWDTYGCKRKVRKGGKHDVLTEILWLIWGKSGYGSWGPGHWIS